MRVVLFLCGLALLTAVGCGSDEETPASATADQTVPEEGTTADETAPSGEATCADVDAPAAREDGDATAPQERLDPETTFTLVFATSCGTFTVTLDQASAPATSASLVALARDGFFDDTVFHRIVPGFVIQGGDPTQSGSGGPGYSTVDPPAQDAAYERGVVAMAKTAVEPPGTAGSQFFVMTADAGGLAPEYAIVGRVTDGLDVVDAIDAQGDAATELPLKPIVVESVTVAETG